MTKAVSELLEAFDALSQPERHQASVEVLRRSAHAASDELTDEELVATTDELFQELDSREVSDA